MVCSRVGLRQAALPDSLQALQPLLLHLTNVVLLPKWQFQHCCTAFLPGLLLSCHVVQRNLLLQMLSLNTGRRRSQDMLHDTALRLSVS